MEMYVPKFVNLAEAKYNFMKLLLKICTNGSLYTHCGISNRDCCELMKEIALDIPSGDEDDETYNHFL